MFAAFSSLALGVEPPKRGFRPRNNVIADDLGVALTEDDSAVTTRLARMAGFDEMVLLANYQSNYGMFFPPRGYVATVHADARFVSCPWVGGGDLFRGYARVRVDMESDYISDETRKLWERRANLFIRDKSPDPPRFNAPGEKQLDVKGGWVPSVTKGGWVRLSRGRRIEGTKAAGEANYFDRSYWLEVFAGLDEKTCEDADNVLTANSRPGVMQTVGGMFGPNGVMAPLREVARENRARLLAEACECFGLHPLDGATIEEHAEPYAFNKKDPCEDKTDRALAWMQAEGARVPGWFRVPKSAPRGCGPVPEDLAGFHVAEHLPDHLVAKRPRYVNGAKDSPCNDVLAYDDVFMCVYSQSCSTLNFNGVPYTAGPMGTVRVFNAFDGEDWVHKPTKNAFPTEAAPDPRVDPLTLRRGTELCTWEKADLQVNRNLARTWAYKEPSAAAAPAPGSVAKLAAPTAVKPLAARYGEACRTAASLELEPMLVRVSAFDPYDLAVPPATRAARFSKAMVDLSYAPL